MSVNSILIGATVIAVGTVGYFMFNKLNGRKSTVVNYPISVKQMDEIDFSCLGQWLKEIDFDLDDVKNTRIFAVKMKSESLKKFNLHKIMLENVAISEDMPSIAFVLTDQDITTKQVLIAQGKRISEKIQGFTGDVMEINLNLK